MKCPVGYSAQGDGVMAEKTRRKEKKKKEIMAQLALDSK